MGQKVWIAAYSHRHGEDFRAFDSEAKCLKWREEIADEWWDREIGGPKPDTPEKVADEYFDRKAMDLGTWETFHFQEAEIE